jgi:hypothetical protein
MFRFGILVKILNYLNFKFLQILKKQKRNKKEKAAKKKEQERVPEPRATCGVRHIHSAPL